MLARFPGATLVYCFVIFYIVFAEHELLTHLLAKSTPKVLVVYSAEYEPKKEQEKVVHVSMEMVHVKKRGTRPAKRGSTACVGDDSRTQVIVPWVMETLLDVECFNRVNDIVCRSSVEGNPF